jgi:hypothetical protein
VGESAGSTDALQKTVVSGQMAYYADVEQQEQKLQFYPANYGRQKSSNT